AAALYVCAGGVGYGALGQVDADDLGPLDQRVQDLAGPGDEGGGAAGPGRAGHGPGGGAARPDRGGGPPGRGRPLSRAACAPPRTRPAAVRYGSGAGFSRRTVSADRTSSKRSRRPACSSWALATSSVELVSAASRSPASPRRRRASATSGWAGSRRSWAATVSLSSSASSTPACSAVISRAAMAWSPKGW